MTWRPVPAHFAVCTRSELSGELVPLLSGDDLADLDERRQILVAMTGGQARLVLVWGHDGDPVTKGQAARLLPQPCPRLRDGSLPESARPVHPMALRAPLGPLAARRPEPPSVDPDEQRERIREARVARALAVPIDLVLVGDEVRDPDGRTGVVLSLETWAGGCAAVQVDGEPHPRRVPLGERGCGLLGWALVRIQSVAAEVRACDAAVYADPAPTPARRPDPTPPAPSRPRDARRCSRP